MIGLDRFATLVGAQPTAAGQLICFATLAGAQPTAPVQLIHFATLCNKPSDWSAAKLIFRALIG